MTIAYLINIRLEQIGISSKQFKVDYRFEGCRTIFQMALAHSLFLKPDTEQCLDGTGGFGLRQSTGQGSGDVSRWPGLITKTPLSKPPAF